MVNKNKGRKCIMMIGEEMFLSFEEKQKNTPLNNGHWTGERGNSDFYSNNLEMKKMGAEYITYINGEPDFSKVSIYKFKIPSMTENRLPYSGEYLSNYEQAYRKIAKRRRISISKARKWLKREHYTIHESNDMQTVYILPRKIHETYIHSGGVAEVKTIIRDDEDDEDVEFVEKNGSQNVLNVCFLP